MGFAFPGLPLGVGCLFSLLLFGVWFLGISLLFILVVGFVCVSV